MTGVGSRFTPGASRGTQPPGRPVAARVLAPLRHPVVAVIVRRLVMAVPLLFVVSALSFALVSLTPGDAARQLLGLQASPEDYERMRQELGLDLPVYQQYWDWVQGAVAGDLGRSLLSGQLVLDALLARLPVTLSLIAGALLVSLLVGVALGTLSAVRGGTVARIADAGTLIGFALPGFWVGTILISLFAVQWGLFPATGYVPFSSSPAEWAQSLVLPVTALSLAALAAIAKQTREAMLDVLDSEYIRMARANGVSAGSLLLRHALKNVAVRVVTVLGVQAVVLLSGTVIIEVVFALPGLGSLAVDASMRSDLPMIQAIVVLFTVIVVLINLAIDLLYTVFNPKVRAA